jgi:hypothetical protein
MPYVLQRVTARFLFGADFGSRAQRPLLPRHKCSLSLVAEFAALPRTGSRIGVRAQAASDGSLQRWPIVLTKPSWSDRVEDKAG